MQKTMIIGNLTRDPELSETKFGITVCKFTIAVNRRRTNQDGEKQTDFYNVTAWRGLGETAAKYLAKGNKAFVSGELEPRAYLGNDGEARISLDLTANEIDFLTPKAGEDSYSGSNNHASSKQSSKAPTNSRLKPLPVNYDDDDDIPF